jgi:hypothetical protein
LKLGQAGCVEVPEDVALMLLEGVTAATAAVEPAGAADPDTGNDIMFLNEIRAALMSGLDQGLSSGQPAARAL